MQEASRQRHNRKEYFALFMPKVSGPVDLSTIEDEPTPETEPEAPQLPLPVLIMDEAGVCEIGPGPIKAFSPAPDHYDAPEGSKEALDELIFFEGPPPKKRIGRPPGSKNVIRDPKPAQKKEIDWDKLRSFLASKK